MARRKPTATPVAPRKPLLAWIDFDDGHKSDILAPSCSTEIQTLHARILLNGGAGAPEPLQPPRDLWLAPLG